MSPRRIQNEEGWKAISPALIDHKTRASVKTQASGYKASRGQKAMHSHSGVGKDKGGELLWDSREEPEDPGEALPPIFCALEIHVA